MIAGQPIEVTLPDGLVMRGERWGTGERRALLLHDDDADLDSVRPIASRLAATGFAVTAVDRIGHGASDGETDAGRLDDDLKHALAALVGDCGGYLVGIGRGATALVAIAAIARPSAMALVSPVGLETMPDDAVRGDSSAAVVIFGRWDRRAEQEARDLARRRSGPAALVALPEREQGGRLLDGPLGPQVVNHIVGYLRQVVPIPREEAR